MPRGARGVKCRRACVSMLGGHRRIVGGYGVDSQQAFAAAVGIRHLPRAMQQPTSIEGRAVMPKVSSAMQPIADSKAAQPADYPPTAVRVAVASIAFLTLVDLFAAQAILPTLAVRYRTSPGMMGVAVNACTLGMALACLGVATFSKRIDRRAGIVSSLALLAVPTALLAHAPDLATFAGLRVLQGLCMATAFALTLAHLGERFTAMSAAAASAAYITGNVASNLIGRLFSAGFADHFGLLWTFYAFAALNLLGALLAARFLAGTRAPVGKSPLRPVAKSNTRGLGDTSLFAAYAIGFCILFAFIGTFTYVNFVMMRPPLSLQQMQLGLVYLVFAPSLLTTPLAGIVAGMAGARRTLLGALGLAALGLPLLLVPMLAPVLIGLTLIGVGTFLAQAAATSFVSRTTVVDRGVASGLYLGSYFLGGLAGAAVLGQLFDQFGWSACVGGVAAAIGVAAVLVFRLQR